MTIALQCYRSEGQSCTLSATSYLTQNKRHYSVCDCRAYDPRLCPPYSIDQFRVVSLRDEIGRVARLFLLMFILGMFDVAGGSPEGPSLGIIERRGNVSIEMIK